MPADAESPVPADPVLAALADLRPEGAPWPPPDWVRGLVGLADLELVVADARAAPDLAVRWMTAMLTDDGRDTLADVRAGDAPAHAAWVLGQLSLSDERLLETTVDSLLAALLTSDDDDRLHEASMDALADLGAPALETVLAAHAAVRRDTHDRFALEHLLALSRLDDPRIRSIIVARLTLDPAVGADLCAEHGDRRYVPMLRERWDALPTMADPDDADTAYRAGRLGDALRDLEAAWTEADQTKYEAWRDVEDRDGDDEGADLAGDLRDVLDAASGFEPTAPPATTALDTAMDLERIDDTPAEPLTRREVPGRNDPCWCRSGKKYKKCHADADSKATGAQGGASRA